MSNPRQPIYDAVQRARGGSGLLPDEWHALNNMLDALGVPLERPEPTEWR